VTALQRFAAALARALTPAEVSEVVTVHAAPTVGSNRAGLYLLSEEEGVLRLAHQMGLPQANVQRLACVPLAAPLPICDCARGRSALWIESFAEFAALYPALCDGVPTPEKRGARCALPLEVEHGLLGVITFGFPEEHPFAEDERVFLLTLAVLCAQALDRARLYEAQRQSNQHLQLLADAGVALAGALDGEVALQSFLSLVLPTLGDFGVVDVVEPTGALRRVTRVPHDRVLEQLLDAAPPLRLETPAGDLAAGVIYASVDDAWIERVTADSEHANLLRRLDVTSMIRVPLAAARHGLGFLFVYGRKGRHYGATELELAAELARRAATAIQTARLYAAAEEAKRAAQAASQLKEEFLATVSHELRTPLSSVLGWAEILATRSGDDPQLQRGLEVIRRNAEAQARIIDDVVDLSRIASGKLRLDLAPLDLTTVVHEAVDLFLPAAHKKSVSVTVEAPSTATWVSGDRDRLLQVVWNLLSNAIKFTPSEGRVTVHVDVGDDLVRVSFADTGDGIDAAFLPFVFERSRQAAPATTRRHGGLGIGLTIVRHIVELHGGTIAAASEGPGRGSTFTLALAATRPSSGAPGWTAPAARAHQASAAGDLVLEGKRVIVVDDDDDIRDAALTLLRARGAEVRGASSAADAFTLLQAAPPDVLVSDIAMPDEDGLSLVRRMRAAGGDLARVPTIALTAFTREESKQRIFDAGFDAHVPKPLDADTLTRTILAVAAPAKT
jgi:signal transduction histidine kinase/ActR/RegA family two-component response regulator